MSQSGPFPQPSHSSPPRHDQGAYSSIRNLPTSSICQASARADSRIRPTLRAAQRRTATEAPALGRLGTGPSALRTNGGAAPASAPAGPHLPRPAEGGGPQRRAVRLGHSSPLRHGSFATRRPPERLAERLAGLCLTSLDRLCIIALVACGDGFGCLSVGGIRGRAGHGSAVLDHSWPFLSLLFSFYSSSRCRCRVVHGYYHP